MKTPTPETTDDAKETPAQELDRLRKEIAAVKQARTQTDADETVIKEKMEKGLTREQAKSVIQRQREHGDARQKAYDESRAARIEALKK